MKRVFLMLLFFSISYAVESPKILTEVEIEIHGECLGKKFWLRLPPTTKALQGSRIMELVYTPETEKTVLCDSPLILINKKLSIIGWDERGFSLSSLIYRKDLRPAGYRIERDIIEGDTNKTVFKTIETKKLAWDVYLAPIMLALSAKKGDSETETIAYDFFSSSDKQSKISWKKDEVQLNGVKHKLIWDDKGFLAKIIGANNKEILSIAGRK